MAQSRLDELNEDARQSAITGNDVSFQYVKTMNAIGDKVILISLGSVSLLLTFIGILFNSQKNTSTLSFKYVIFSVTGFLLCCCCLLLSRWFGSVYRYSTAHKYHMQDRSAVKNEEIRLFNASTPVQPDGVTPLTTKEKNAYLKKLRVAQTKLDTQAKKDKAKEEIYHKLYQYFLLGGYLFLAIAYIFTLIFFLGVIAVLNN